MVCACVCMGTCVQGCVCTRVCVFPLPPHLLLSPYTLAVTVRQWRWMKSPVVAWLSILWAYTEEWLSSSIECLRNLCSDFHNGCTSLCSGQLSLWIPLLSLTSSPTLLAIFFFFWAHWVRWDLSVVLISMIANDITFHIFIGHLYSVFIYLL